MGVVRRTAGPPDLKSVLADHPQWSARELRDALLVDEQFRWRTPRPWSTEDYLALIPPRAADDELALDLIYGGCRGRIHTGNPPDLAGFASRFPDLAEPLRRQLEVWEWMKDEG